MSDFENSPLRKVSKLLNQQREERDQLLKQLEIDMEKEITGVKNVLGSKTDEGEISIHIANVEAKYQQALTYFHEQRVK